MVKKPNILLITADQMRHDALGSSGNKIIRTPHLDALAGEGVSFKNAYTPSPICVPARASITTGCYPHKCTGVKDNAGSISENFSLLGSELTRAGYKTYAMGKLHYLPYAPPGAQRTAYGIEKVELAESGRILRQFDPEGRMRGLEDYHDYLYSKGWGGYERAHGLGNNDIFPAPSPVPQEYYVDSWVADRAVEHMRNHLESEPESPFFMWASFPKPHSAFDPPRPYDKMYDPREMTEPIGSIELLKERGLGYICARENMYMWQFFSPEAKKLIKAYYYGLISHQDMQAGRLLEFLREKGIEKNTIVIYTADHGEMLGDFGIYFKTCFYSGSVKIPLIIKYPGVFPAGLNSDVPAGLQDILPTVLAAAGLKPEYNVDGLDLAGVIRCGKAEREYYVSQCFEPPNQQYMAADKNWKYIYHQQGGVEELYSLDEDPLELNNLFKSARAGASSVRRRMREYVIEWCRENGDYPMLDAQGLVKAEPKSPEDFKDAPNPYGRRFY